MARAKKKVEDKNKSSIVNHERYHYKRTRIKSPDGAVKTVVSNGDAVARAMSYLSTDDLPKLARAQQVKLSTAKNAGVRKMALANSLRALVRGGAPVKIGEYVVKTLDQKRPDFKQAMAPAPRKRGRKSKG